MGILCASVVACLPPPPANWQGSYLAAPLPRSKLGWIGLERLAALGAFGSSWCSYTRCCYDGTFKSVEGALPVGTPGGLDPLEGGPGGHVVAVEAGPVLGGRAAVVLGDVDDDGRRGHALAQHVDLLGRVQLVLLSCKEKARSP